MDQQLSQLSSSLPIPLNRQTEIIRLHNEIVGQLRQSLENAMRIGELLSEQKTSMSHGEFTAWVRANLPFSDRTARNYMRVYRKRKQIKTETVSDLTDAYHLLIEHREPQEHPAVIPLKVLDMDGREEDYTERLRKLLFDLDVEWVIYQFPFETPDEKIYEGLMDRFRDRETRNRIPNTFSREIYEGIKFAALKEIEYRVERFESDLKRFLEDNEDNPDVDQEFWPAEHRRKSLKQRWAYRCFITLLCLRNYNPPKNKQLFDGLIWKYREMYDA